jgi:hypothetical protein
MRLPFLSVLIAAASTASLAVLIYLVDSQGL